MGELMVGREVNFHVEKGPAHPTDVALEVKHLTMINDETKKKVVNDVSFEVRKGEIVAIAGIDGNGQSELIYGITGLMPINEGEIFINGEDYTKKSIRAKNLVMSHIPEDRHKFGLILDYPLSYNLALKNYFTPEFVSKAGFLKFNRFDSYADELIDKFDIRSGQGKITMFIHKQLVEQRDEGRAVLLMSFELDEVMDVADRIIVMFEGEIMGVLDPKKVTVEEVGLYMAGVKREEKQA